MLAALTSTLALLAVTDPQAVALVDTALARMGGRSALEQITRLRIEQLTEWHRTMLDGRPSPLVGSYERDTEWRDYSIPAWRYVRRFMGANGSQEIVDVVTDSVAITSSAVARPLVAEAPGKLAVTWRPLSVAYVDERAELFATTPDRILLRARSASSLSRSRDTAIAGAWYSRVIFTADSVTYSLFFARSTGLLAIARFRQAQLRDFGLVPWGVMEVEVRYSKWVTGSTGISLPYQQDIYRVGSPYKRVTWIAVQLNPTIVADSFAIEDSLRSSFFRTQNRPMHDLPLDSARVVEGAFAIFGTPGTPAGAVKVGGFWVLMESGAAPISAERSIAFLKQASPGTTVAAAILTLPAGAGGLPHYVRNGIPVYVAGSAKPYVDASAKGWNVRTSGLRSLTPGRSVRIGTDSLIIDSVELPEMAHAALVYLPSLRWLYSPAMAFPYGRALILERARANGWIVDRLSGPGLALNGIAPSK